MRCDAALQSLKVHLIFLGGIPPRMGSVMCRVAFWGIERVERVVAAAAAAAAAGDVGSGVGGVGGRAVWGRPAWTRLIEEAGAEVRRERRCWRWAMGVEDGIVRGIAVEVES